MARIDPATVDAVLSRFQAVQAAMEAMRACIHAGDAASIQVASQSLTDLLSGIEDDTTAVKVIMDGLGASSVTEASHILCERGEKHAAHALMRLDATARAVVGMRADASAFIAECLDTLDAARERATPQGGRGRLLGSA